MIKLAKIAEEFTSNPKETPVISFGNTKRKTSTMPSLQMQDMAAMEEEVCEDCGSSMAGGHCSQCGEEEKSSHNVWGQPSDDHESMMARGELRDMISNASKIYNMIEPGTELPGWVSAYITLASDYMHSVTEYATETTQDMSETKLKEAKGTKVDRGEMWLDTVFLDTVMPKYVPGELRQSFSTNLKPGQYTIDHDKDGAGNTICFLTVACTEEQYSDLMGKLKASYDDFAAPFKRAAAAKNYGSSILSNDEDMTLTFEITVFR